jgi:bifunctional DNase/RNase
MLVPVEISSFTLDAGGSFPVLVLKESSGTRILEIPISPLEAGALALQSLDVALDIPQTIRLCKSLIVELGAHPEKAVLVKNEKSAVIARLHVTHQGKTIIIECRPGDALSLSAQCSIPLFAEESLFTMPGGADPSVDNDALRAAILNTDTIEFGRYHLE